MQDVSTQVSLSSVIVCKTFLSCLTLCNTSFFTLSFQLISCRKTYFKSGYCRLLLQCSWRFRSRTKTGLYYTSFNICLAAI